MKIRFPRIQIGWGSVLGGHTTGSFLTEVLSVLNTLKIQIDYQKKENIFKNPVNALKKIPIYDHLQFEYVDDLSAMEIGFLHFFFIDAVHDPNIKLEGESGYHWIEKLLRSTILKNNILRIERKEEEDHEQDEKKEDGEDGETPVVITPPLNILPFYGNIEDVDKIIEHADKVVPKFSIKDCLGAIFCCICQKEEIENTCYYMCCMCCLCCRNPDLLFIPFMGKDEDAKERMFRYRKHFKNRRTRRRDDIPEVRRVIDNVNISGLEGQFSEEVEQMKKFQEDLENEEKSEIEKEKEGGSCLLYALCCCCIILYFIPGNEELFALPKVFKEDDDNDEPKMNSKALFIKMFRDLKDDFSKKLGILSLNTFQILLKLLLGFWVMVIAAILLIEGLFIVTTLFVPTFVGYEAEDDHTTIGLNADNNYYDVNKPVIYAGDSGVSGLNNYSATMFSVRLFLYLATVIFLALVSFHIVLVFCVFSDHLEEHWTRFSFKRLYGEVFPNEKDFSFLEFFCGDGCCNITNCCNVLKKFVMMCCCKDNHDMEEEKHGLSREVSSTLKKKEMTSTFENDGDIIDLEAYDSLALYRKVIGIRTDYFFCQSFCLLLIGSFCLCGFVGLVILAPVLFGSYPLLVLNFPIVFCCCSLVCCCCAEVSGIYFYISDVELEGYENDLLPKLILFPLFFLCWSGLVIVLFGLFGHVLGVLLGIVFLLCFCCFCTNFYVCCLFYTKQSSIRCYKCLNGCSKKSTHVFYSYFDKSNRGEGKKKDGLDPNSVLEKAFKYVREGADFETFSQLYRTMEVDDQKLYSFLFAMKEVIPELRDDRIDFDDDYRHDRVEDSVEPSSAPQTPLSPKSLTAFLYDIPSSKTRNVVEEKEDSDSSDKKEEGQEEEGGVPMISTDESLESENDSEEDISSKVEILNLEEESDVKGGNSEEDREKVLEKVKEDIARWLASPKESQWDDIQETEETEEELVRTLTGDVLDCFDMFGLGGEDEATTLEAMGRRFVNSPYEKFIMEEVMDRVSGNLVEINKKNMKKMDCFENQSQVRMKTKEVLEDMQKENDESWFREYEKGYQFCRYILERPIYGLDNYPIPKATYESITDLIPNIFKFVKKIVCCYNECKKSRKSKKELKKKIREQQEDIFRKAEERRRLKSITKLFIKKHNSMARFFPKKKLPDLPIQADKRKRHSKSEEIEKRKVEMIEEEEEKEIQMEEIKIEE